MSFAWGQGYETNNRAKALTLWQGLKIAHSKNIISLSVFGDSQIIIQVANSKRNPAQVHLSTILKKVKLMHSKFQKIRFFHILRNLNSMTDLEANNGTLLSKNSLSVNGTETLCNIP